MYVEMYDNFVPLSLYFELPLSKNIVRLICLQSSNDIVFTSRFLKPERYNYMSYFAQTYCLNSTWYFVFLPSNLGH